MDAMVPATSASSVFSKVKQAVLSAIPSVNLPFVIWNAAESRDVGSVGSAGDPNPPPATPSKLSYCAAMALGPALFPVLLPVTVGSYVYNRRRSTGRASGVTTEQTCDEELLISTLDDSSTEPNLIQLGLTLHKHRFHGYLSLSVTGNGLDKVVLVRKGGRCAQPNLYRVAIFPSRILELKYDSEHGSASGSTAVSNRRRLSCSTAHRLHIPRTKCLRYEIAHVMSAKLMDLDSSDECWYEFCARFKADSTTQYLDWEQYTADQAVQAMAFWLKQFTHKSFRLDSAIDLALIERGPASTSPILEESVVRNAKPAKHEIRVNCLKRNAAPMKVLGRKTPTDAPDADMSDTIRGPLPEPAREEPKKKVSRFDSIFKSAVYQKEAAPQTTKQVDGVKFYEENISARLAEVDKENNSKASNTHAHISMPKPVECEPKLPAQAVQSSVENKNSGQHSLLRPVSANKTNGRTPKPRGYRRVSYSGYRERIEARAAKQSHKVPRHSKKSNPSQPEVASQMQDQSAAPISPVQPAVEQVDKAPKQPVSKFSSFFRSSSYADKVRNNAISTDEPFAGLGSAKPHESDKHKDDMKTVPAQENQNIPRCEDVEDQPLPGPKTHTGQVGVPEDQSSAPSGPIPSANEQMDEVSKKPVSRFGAFFNSSRYVDKVSKNVVRADGPFADLNPPKPDDPNEHKGDAVTVPTHRQELALQNQAVLGCGKIDHHGSDQSKELDVRAHGALMWVPPERQPLSTFPPTHGIVDPFWDECDRNPRCRKASDALLSGEPNYPLVDRIVDNILGHNRIEELGEVYHIEDVDLADSQPLGNPTHLAPPNDQNGFAKTLRAERPSHGVIGDSRPMIRRVKKVPNLREPDVSIEHVSNTPDIQAPKTHPGPKGFAAPNANSWSTTGLKIIKHKRDDSGVVLNVLEEDELEAAKMYFHEANALFRTRMENIKLRNGQLASSPDSSEIGSSPPVGIPAYGNKIPIQGHVEAQQPFFSALDRLQRRNAHVFAVDANGFDSSDFGSSFIEPPEEDSRKQAEARMEFPEEDAAMLNEAWDVEHWRDCAAHAEWHNLPRLRIGSVGVQG